MQKSKRSFAKIILAFMIIFALAIPMSCAAADEVAAPLMTETTGTAADVAAEPVFTLGEGEDAVDVTANYDITYVDGTLTVISKLILKQLSLRFVSQSASMLQSGHCFRPSWQSLLHLSQRKFILHSSLVSSLAVSSMQAATLKPQLHT